MSCEILWTKALFYIIIIIIIITRYHILMMKYRFYDQLLPLQCIYKFSISDGIIISCLCHSLFFILHPTRLNFQEFYYNRLDITRPTPFFIFFSSHYVDNILLMVFVSNGQLSKNCIHLQQTSCTQWAALL